jgi:hypothetical protein
MSLKHVLTNWRPGSHDWTWREEFNDLRMNPDHSAVTDAVRRRVESEGIDFADHFAPVLLGSDGRVWDGHHRLCIAADLGIQTLRVEVAGEGSDQDEPADVDEAYFRRVCCGAPSSSGTELCVKVQDSHGDNHESDGYFWGGTWRDHVRGSHDVPAPEPTTNKLARVLAKHQLADVLPGGVLCMCGEELAALNPPLDDGSVKGEPLALAVHQLQEMETAR